MSAGESAKSAKVSSAKSLYNLSILLILYILLRFWYSGTLALLALLALWARLAHVSPLLFHASSRLSSVLKLPAYMLKIYYLSINPSQNHPISESTHHKLNIRSESTLEFLHKHHAASSTPHHAHARSSSAPISSASTATARRKFAGIRRRA